MLCCVYCGVRYLDISTHISTIHPGRPLLLYDPLQCTFCHKSPNRPRHTKSCRLNPIRTVHTCNHCGKAFYHHISLSRHIKVHLPFYNCYRCKYNTHDLTAILDHIIVHNLTVFHDNDAFNRCPFCLLYIKGSVWKLFYHARRYQCKAFDIECEDCTCKFQSKWALRVHKNIVHKGNVQFCQYCKNNFGYVQMRKFKSHIKKCISKQKCTRTLS